MKAIHCILILYALLFQFQPVRISEWKGDLGRKFHPNLRVMDTFWKRKNSFSLRMRPLVGQLSSTCVLCDRTQLMHKGRVGEMVQWLECLLLWQRTQVLLPAPTCTSPLSKLLFSAFWSLLLPFSDTTHVHGSHRCPQTKHSFS